MSANFVLKKALKEKPGAMTFMKLFFLLSAFLAACIMPSNSIAVLEPVENALPLVGTGDHGHTYPGATVPFGFVQLSPDTRTDGWDACSGYHYSDSSILGFSHTHLSGTGCADFGDIMVMPVTGELNEANNYKPLDSERFKSSFSHENETAQPGYYKVKLDKYNIQVELTATPHVGMHRYSFLDSGKCHLLLDLVHGLNNKPVESFLKIESRTTISGYRRSNGWAKDRIVYFIIECSKPFDSFGLELDGKPLSANQIEVRGRNVRGDLDYQNTAGQQIILRVGLSPTSVDEARNNLQSEIPGWDFDAVCRAAQAVWNENLSRIRIETPNPNIRQTFYSAFYHTMTAPTLYNDVDGYYRGPDKETHAGSGSQYYSTFSMWDIFRAEAPLMTLVQPERVNDFVQSMLSFYQESDDRALPMWPLASYETWCMIGYHSVPIIWDAYSKGFRGFDAELAYKAMRDTAMSERNRQDEYQRFGYVPWVKGRQAATSMTLEFSYDDWCIAQMAGALGKTNDAELFKKRSLNYKNVWDPTTSFFRSKNPDGTFHEPFDPKECANWTDSIGSDSYTEADAWQYAFFVPQDVPGMIELYGGKQPFINKLDQLFNEDSDMSNWTHDVTGIIGQYAQGNEPVHHVAYLYALAGAQYKTAQRVRQIMLTQYDNSPEGIPGNDDCGQISAWYVWSAIGLYPLNPASGVYVIGSPIVEKATIQLDPKFYNGGTFTIIAHNASRQNCYVQSAKLNGQVLNRPWITHQEIVNGGTLELQMGILPNKAWGASTN